MENRGFVLFAALFLLYAPRSFAADAYGAADEEPADGFDAEEALSAEDSWQRFAWDEEAPEFVLKYEVIVEARDDKGGGYAEVRRMFTQENSVRPDPLLPMGAYRFKIVTYNLLGLPSAESDWTAFTVIKAFQPEIRNVSVQANRTSTIYLDEYNDGVLSVGGRNLFLPEPAAEDAPSTSYLLVKDGRKGGARLSPEILEHAESGRSLLLAFDMDALDVGTYHLVATDASGLSTPADGRNQISVKFKKPSDLDVSVGYVLPVVMFDGTIRTYMGSSVWPLSAMARISFLPFKHRSGYFGLGLTGTYTRMSHAGAAYSVDGNLVTAHVNFVYQRPFKRRAAAGGGFRRFLLLEAHGGAGGTYFCNYAFHFPHDVSTEPLNSINASFDVGGAVQLYFTNRFYAEACMDVSVAVVPDISFGLFLPSVSVGWQF